MWVEKGLARNRRRRSLEKNKHGSGVCGLFNWFSSQALSRTCQDCEIILDNIVAEFHKLVWLVKLLKTYHNKL